MGGVTGGELPVGANVGVGALARRRRSSTAAISLGSSRSRLTPGDANNPRGAGGGAARGALPHRGALPVDALSLVLYQLPLAHDIAAVAPTCHVLCDAAKLALKLRPFSGEVVTLGGHAYAVMAVATAPDGRIITGSDDGGLNVWRDGVCEHSISQGSGELRGGGGRAVRASSASRTTAP